MEKKKKFISKPEKIDYIRGFILISIFGIGVLSSSTFYKFLYEPSQIEKDIKLTQKHRNKIPQIACTQSFDAKQASRYIQYTNSKIYQTLSSVIINHILFASDKYKVNPRLILAIIKTESNFNIFAKNNSLATGLMQVRPKGSNGKDVWFKELKEQNILKNINDLYDPKINIIAGTYIINKYFKQNNGNLQKALGAYYGAKSKIQAKPYIDKIIKNMGRYLFYQMYEKGD